MEQTSIYDYMEPDYKGSQDEILRLSAETALENNIALQPCCGQVPGVFFKSCHEYRVKCERCGAKTKTYGKAYKAMQAWNRGNRNG